MKRTPRPARNRALTDPFNSSERPVGVGPFAPSARAQVARDPTGKFLHASCSGWYSSLKMGAQFPFESLPERDAMVLLDVDPEVEGFRAQPETFAWVDGGSRRRYTPDLLVAIVDGRREYREVKRGKRRMEDPKLGGRLERIEALCAERGAAFDFWTVAEIRREPRLSNAKRLRAAVAFLGGGYAALARAAICAADLPAPLGELEAALGSEPRMVGALLGLAALGEIRFDMGAAIGPQAIVTAGIAA